MMIDITIKFIDVFTMILLYETLYTSYIVFDAKYKL